MEGVIIYTSGGVLSDRASSLKILFDWSSAIPLSFHEHGQNFVIPAP